MLHSLIQQPCNMSAADHLPVSQFQQDWWHICCRLPFNCFNNSTRLVTCQLQTTYLFHWFNKTGDMSATDHLTVSLIQQGWWHVSCRPLNCFTDSTRLVTCLLQTTFLTVLIIQQDWWHVCCRPPFNCLNNSTRLVTCLLQTSYLFLTDSTRLVTCQLQNTF